MAPVDTGPEWRLVRQLGLVVLGGVLVAAVVCAAPAQSVSATASAAVPMNPPNSNASPASVRPTVALPGVAGSQGVTNEVRPPFHIGGDPAYGPAPVYQGSPAVASNGTSYLVVWASAGESESDIYGARVSAEGVVLDSLGIIISAAAHQQGVPAVAFNGTDYLVVWQDERNGSTDIYGARVSASGAVLDTAGIAICAAARDQESPAIASDGTQCLVVWTDLSTTYSNVHGARVSASGAILDAAGIAISTATNSQRSPAVAFDGTNYLVVWEDLRNAAPYLNDIYASRVTTAGVVLDPAGKAIMKAGGTQMEPAVAFNGTNYLVVWVDSRGADGNGSVFGSRVNTSGTALDPTGVDVSLYRAEHSRVTSDGTDFMVVWQDYRDFAGGKTYGARVSAAGTVLDPGGLAISSVPNPSIVPSSEAIAFGGTSYLVVWEDIRTEEYCHISGARVSSGGVVLDSGGVAVSIGVNSQLKPGIAFDGTNYLVVWSDWRNSSYDIYGVRVSADGNVLDPGGIAISAAPGFQTDPCAAFDGTNYLVVWEDTRSGGLTPHTYGARVSVGGTVLDPGGIAISSSTKDESFPVVAFDGTNYLVVWQETIVNSPAVIRGARVSTDGVVLDPAGIIISASTTSRWYPGVAFDGTNYLVVWSDWRNYNYDAYATRVSTVGVVLDPGGIAVSTNAAEQYAPAVAFDGWNYLVVWADYRNGSAYMYGARVTVAGAVLDTAGIAISTAGGGMGYPVVAFDGMDYRVVWADYRNGSADIYGARVDPEGNALNPAGVCISMDACDQLYPALARGGGSDMLVAYQSFTPRVPYNTTRIWGNLWERPTAIAFASASAEAGQGYVELSWQMAVETLASSFRIERSDSPEGGFTELDLVIVSSPGFRFACTDNSVRPGQTYWYRIVLVGTLGSVEEACGPIEVCVDGVPTAFIAYQSYPNPFNPTCTIRYDLPTAGRMTLRILDARGTLVRTLTDGWREPGAYRDVWDGRGEGGAVLASGVYFYRLELGGFRATHKIVLLK